jgi:hypothetical protein
VRIVSMDFTVRNAFIKLIEWGNLPLISSSPSQMRKKMEMIFFRKKLRKSKKKFKSMSFNMEYWRNRLFKNGIA